MSESKGKKSDRSSGRKVAPPKGTRDAYPDDVLRRRYVTQAWRDAAIRCGFDEIEGPTFEAADLYAVKSGDGILGELFQAFSGKSPEEVESVQREGKAPYALRPEFTPTLARMYAARAKQLPQPCKWFTAGPYFRAEKPQRGRLREFLQWNVDVIGAPDEHNLEIELDAEVVTCLVNLLTQLGLDHDGAGVQYSDRAWLYSIFVGIGLDDSQIDTAYALLDRVGKKPAAALREDAMVAGISDERFLRCLENPNHLSELSEAGTQMPPLHQQPGLGDWCNSDPTIVRGLAYYTGTVFEVIADGERAVAGGGRYDNLIELFGGPPTPACGFGMGDVVLSNLLDDKGLFPEGQELMEAVSRAPASVRPEAFVIHDGSDEARAHVRPLVAALRRGVEAPGFEGRPWSDERYAAGPGGGGGGGGGVRPMHARQSYKATGNPGKLWSDGVKQNAMYVVEIKGDGSAQLKSVATNAEVEGPDAGRWSVEPASEGYVGRGLRRAMG